MSSLGVGGCITAIVVLLQARGVLQGWEYRSIDWRYRNVPRDTEPMTPQIVHIDIDDSAIAQIGRWPWDRSILADAIDELFEAGARVVALDLHLSAPSVDPNEVDQETCELDHDARLSGSLDKVDAVLAVTLHRDDDWDDLWTQETGPRDLRHLLDLLGGDLERSIDSIAKEAGLTDSRAEHFAQRPFLYKRAAAMHALQTRDDLATFEELESALMPNLNRLTGSYPEEKTLLAAWDQHQAWKSLRTKESVFDEPSPGQYFDLAPVQVLTDSAYSAGFINVDLNPQGESAVREVSIRAPAPGGKAVQFGLAAAAAFDGLKPENISFADDMVTIGDVSLPLHDGKLWLDWPATETDWLGLLRQPDSDLDTPGHISIRQLVEMARARRTLASNRQLMVNATLRIAIHRGLDIGIDIDLEDINNLDNLDMVREGVKSTLANGDEDAAHIQDCELWEYLDSAIPEDAERLKKAIDDMKDRVQGRLAFVGWIATGSVADFVPTPVGPKTPGVVIHATVAHMVLKDRSASFMPPWLELVLTALLGVLCTAAAARFSAVVSTVIAVAVVATYVLVAGVWAFASSTALAPMVAPVLSGGASWMACTALIAVVAQLQRRQIEGQFKTRVSEQLVKQLIKHPDRVSLTGKEREMTIMFGDLARFTSIAESLSVQATVATLNRYMILLTDRLTGRGAYLNKFLGDGFMAFWSAFEEDDAQESKACGAALDCQRVMTTLNEDTEDADAHPHDMALRIGIATGKVVVGDCGAPPKLNDYTVIGDKVNLAARLESANKQFGTNILIDGSTQSKLEPDKILTRPIGSVVVVGQSVPVDLFAVLPAETDKDEAQSLMDLSAELVAAATSGRIEDARQFVEAIKREHGADRISEMYVERLADDAWDGVIWLADK